MQDFRNKKIGLRICAFCMVMIFVLAALSVLFDPVRLGMENEVPGGENYYLNLLAEPENMTDVLILGDSESISFLSTYDLWKDQGIASYIAGEPGDQISHLYYKLRKILKTQSPKVVILETNVLFAAIANVYDELNYIRGAIVDYYFPIFRYHGLWKQAVCKKNVQSSAFNGFDLRTQSDPYTKGTYMFESTGKSSFSRFVRMYMDRLRNLCRKNGIELLFVTSPSPLNHTMEKHNALEAYAKQYGITYIDLNLKTEEIGIDWETDTLDGGDHLNYAGSKKVTEYLEEYLKKQYGLTDHRQDKRYADWNANADDFSKLLQ
ncbi:SGNH/GDSL hydrolase family protein [Eubacterium sp. MSJ-21]|nr:SGNH/GDSL hydrolase family protein [Eubacterium sp. MSJ-21]